MRFETLLADKLRAADFDLSRMSDVQLAEVYRLARAARIELPRPGVKWPNIAGTAVLAGPVTEFDAHGRRQP